LGNKFAETEGNEPTALTICKSMYYKNQILLTHELLTTFYSLQIAS
jgi:hypothetical protein